MTYVTDSSDQATPTDDQANRSGKTWVRFVGIGIGAVGLAFAFYALANARDELADAQLSPRTFAIAAIVGIAGMATIGLNWIRIIRLFGGSTPLRKGLHWYFVGQLGKYIPGGLWAVLGRGELATRGGIGRAASYTSVGVSLATTYAAAATVGALFLAFGASSLVSRISWLVLSAVTIAAAVLGLTEPMMQRIRKPVSRFGIAVKLPSMAPGASLLAILSTAPAWLCIGAATALTGRALGFSVDFDQVIAATSYSWLAGFLIVPMPGGLGVREAVFIALFPGTTPEAAALAVTARIVFILVDLAGAATATLVERLTAGARI